MDSNLKYNLNINFKNRNNLIAVDFDILISELKQIIFSYFKIIIPNLIYIIKTQKYIQMIIVQ